MIRKFIALAVTSGVAAKLYKMYVERQQKERAVVAPQTRRRRRAGPVDA
ncbi:MAG TPA: hypothetical protein VE934_03295 [Polaromonas sp.]|nr:hypothetical protein [Polaromonas sp.]HYW55955.1 hypothetical protein [Polaromonas sp.]